VFGYFNNLTIARTKMKVMAQNIYKSYLSNYENGYILENQTDRDELSIVCCNTSIGLTNDKIVVKFKLSRIEEIVS
jgi:hypothetical protein